MRIDYSGDHRCVSLAAVVKFAAGHHQVVPVSRQHDSEHISGELNPNDYLGGSLDGVFLKTSKPLGRIPIVGASFPKDDNPPVVALITADARDTTHRLPNSIVDRRSSPIKKYITSSSSSIATVCWMHSMRIFSKAECVLQCTAALRGTSPWFA